MTAEANVMRIASRTMSEVRMKTWLAASAVLQAHHGHAAPGDAAASSSQTNLSRQLSTRTSPRGCARNLRQAAIMKNFMEMTVASQAEACMHGRPEHRGEREDDGEQREGDARRQLVLHEHRQQLVLELRLQARCPATGVRAARAYAPGRPRADPCARARAQGSLCLAALHRLPRQAARPIADRSGRRLAATWPRRQSRPANS